jgi:hypothetical protein
MIMTKIDASGNLAWMKKLPKRQRGRQEMGGMSYRYFACHGDHYLLFLDSDSEKNMTITESYNPSGYLDGDGGLLMAYKVADRDGSVEKMYILDTRDIKGTEIFQFRTSRIKEVGSDAFVFEAYKKKGEDILVKVQIK